jgi:choline monooxygenase
VFAEDASIYDGVQKGLEASPHPGVIGVREERVFAFQKYVLDNTRGAVELRTVEPPADPARSA